jgi:hypothetical protein
MWCTAASDSGPRVTTVRASAGTSRSSAGPAGSGRRAAKSQLTRVPGERRRAKESTPAELGSSHWTSSTATSTGASAPIAASRLRIPVASALGSEAAPTGAARSIATSSASRCGSASEVSASGSTGSKRSATAERASFVSASAGLHERTRNPRDRARSAISRQSVVFPIPGSPSRRSTPNSSCARSRKESATSSSASRPRTAGTPGSVETAITADPIAETASWPAFCAGRARTPGPRSRRRRCPPAARPGTRSRPPHRSAGRSSGSCW